MSDYHSNLPKWFKRMFDAGWVFVGWGDGYWRSSDAMWYHADEANVTLSGREAYQLFRELHVPDPYQVADMQTILGLE